MTRGRSSLHDHIVGHLRDRIVGGAWPPGHRIPSEAELTQQFACSRMTVNKALSQLAAAGLIERRRKAGSFVTMPRARPAVLEISNIRAEAENFGPYRFEIARRIIRPATPDDAPRLDCGRADVLEVEVVHFGGALPLCLERRLINLAVVPEARNETFETMPPGMWLVERVPFSEGEHRLRAEAADATVAARLAIRKGAPCFVIERRTWRAGRPITHVRFDYPGHMQEMVARFGGI